MGARPYDPALGRFLEVDPVPGGSLNNYDYAGQDPVNGYDLDGRCCWLGLGGFISVIFGPAGEKAAYNHSPQIAGTLGVISLFPGGEVAAPFAVVFGAVAAVKDRHHPAAAALDAGSVLGTGASMRLAELAASLDRAASTMRYAKYADWLRADAAALRNQKTAADFVAAGLSGLALGYGRW
jgi:hypothetical protein